jgi:enoyl-CoA hydratase
MPNVRLEAREGGTRLITLTDADRRNAMGYEMAAELRAASAEVAADPASRVLVITGEGAAFCAGGDLPQLFGDTDRPTAAIHDGLRDFYRAFLDVHDLALPTIAAVNGPAVGAGLNLALACDLRVAGPDAVFGATFARIGLHPGGGCTWFLVRMLGPSRALRTLLLGDSIDAAGAIAAGLAEGPYDDPLDAALELARRIGETDQALARHIKQAVRLAVTTDDLDAVVAYESWAQAASTSSPKLRAWVDRFRQS